MEYYNQNNELIKIDSSELEVYDYGGYSNIYLYQADKILKKYYKYVESIFKLQKEIYNVIKDIDSPNFVKLYDILYNDKNDEQISAYTAKYYQKSNMNILNENKLYFLDNIDRIEKLFEIFTENNILVHDLKKANTIITSSDIVVIDPDLFEIAKTEKEQEFLNSRNKMNLLGLLKNMFLNSIGGDTFLYIKIINDLFDMEVEETKSIAHEVSKRLSKCKTPIEYLQNKI